MKTKHNAIFLEAAEQTVSWQSVDYDVPANTENTILFFFAVLRLELRAYTLSHFTSSFL
jgi:hypothetical protein